MKSALIFLSGVLFGIGICLFFSPGSRLQTFRTTEAIAIAEFGGPGRLIGLLPPGTTMYGPAVDTRLDRYWWGYVPVLLGPQDDAEKVLRRESRRARLRDFPASGLNGIGLDSEEYAELLPFTEQLTQTYDSAPLSEGEK